MTANTPDNDDREATGSTRAAEVTYDVDEGEQPSVAVVRAVASLTDTPVLDLDPLYDVVDPAHLDGLADAADGRSALTESSVTFRFNGCEVTVTQDTVHVQACEDDTS